MSWMQIFLNVQCINNCVQVSSGMTWVQQQRRKDLINITLTATTLKLYTYREIIYLSYAMLCLEVLRRCFLTISCRAKWQFQQSSGIKLILKITTIIPPSNPHLRNTSTQLFSVIPQMDFSHKFLVHYRPCIVSVMWNGQKCQELHICVFGILYFPNLMYNKKWLLKNISANW